MTRRLFLVLMLFACERSHRLLRVALLEEPGALSVDVKAALQKFLDTHAQGDVLAVKDGESSSEKRMKYMRMLHPVRRLDKKTYIICAEFWHADQDEENLYDVDFRIEDEAGQLAVIDFKIHKAPKFINGSWQLVSRYDYVDVEDIAAVKKSNRQK